VAQLVAVVGFDQSAVDQSDGAIPLDMEPLTLLQQIAQVFQRGHGRALTFGGQLLVPKQPNQFFDVKLLSLEIFVLRARRQAQQPMISCCDISCSVSSDEQFCCSRTRLEHQG